MLFRDQDHIMFDPMSCMVLIIHQVNALAIYMYHLALYLQIAMFLDLCSRVGS